MPTPIEILSDPISFSVLVTYFGLALAEALFPGRELPTVRGWRILGTLSFFAFFFLSTYLPMFWDEALAAHTLLDLRELSLPIQIAAALLVYELGLYTWHRTMHRTSVLWRLFHQQHHSAERLDVAGAFWFSPLDMVGWTAIGSLAMVLVLGLDPRAATATILFTTFLGIFQHANLRTPRWLGYLIQRPESHTVHHARGIHDRNFADLPLIDMIFGTFENPAGYEHETGFYEGASARVLEMWRFKDISSPASRSESDEDSLSGSTLVDRQIVATGGG